MNNNIDYFKSLIDKSTYKNIEDLYQQTGVGQEFELIINNIDNKYFGQEKYIQLLKYLRYKSSQVKSSITTIDVLDINYRVDQNLTYRVSLIGESINDYIKKLDLWKAHVIFKTLVNLVNKDKKNNILLMKKVKSSEKTIDLPDLYSRIRIAEENKFTEKDFEIIENLSYKELDSINFRLKQRSSLKIVDNDREFLQIDLTMIKTAQSYRALNDMYATYEIELEYGLKNKLKPSLETLTTMLNENMILHKIIQQSNFLITRTLADGVISYYKNIANVSPTSTFLEARQSISLEVQYLTENIPNRYAVTDKADGERYFLIIMNKCVYFISTNLTVRNSGIELKTDEYNGTILDGEYIFIPKLNRHMFLIFDALFIGSKDIRTNQDFMSRIREASILCNKIFVFSKQKGFEQSIFKATGAFNLEEVLDYHRKEITKMIDNLNNDISVDKQLPLIRCKYFMDSTGAVPWEIFAYSELMWKLYTSELKCPYMLDGLIFQPLQQQYVTNIRDSKMFEYKWKPPEKNSIDFYIQFEKDKNTGKILDVYDNSNDDYVRNKPYRICKLYVGRFGNNRENPELFLEDKGVYWAYLFLEDGEVRDAEGNIVLDNTVVEFYYDNSQGEDSVIPEKFKWKPLRTRYDKTESVLRFGRKYGNNAEVAFKIWRSILTPVLMTDVKDLAQGNNPEKNKFYYDNKIEQLRNKIGHELIILASKQDAYYQKITNLAKPMREFHNWLKSNIIYTYCNKQYNKEQQVSVLDIGCGRGGDILKYYYVNVSMMVGIDIAKDGLYSAVNGAVSRYNQQRKRKPNFPRMYFIQADGGAKLDYEEQNKVLGGMNQDNRKLINQFFGENPTKFDRVCCHLAIHYFLANQTVWSNFKYNLNKIMKPGGYLIVTHLDSDKILDLIGSKNSYEMSYTDDKGRTEKLYEIIKKFDKVEKPVGVGNAIDMHAAWMFESGNFMTEYLVDINFIKQELLKDCDLELVESELFENQYNIHRDFFASAYKYHSNKETLQFLEKVSHYYDDTEINKACYNFTFLHRYSIFRKKEKQAGRQVSREVGRNKQDLFSTVKLSKTNYENGYSFMNSLHYILQKHKIIPQSLNVEGFYKERDIKMVKDDKLTDAKMRSITKKIKISHLLEDGKEYNVVNGLNVSIVNNNKLNKLMDNKKDKTILMSNETGIYSPVFIKNDMDKKQSLFDVRDEFIAGFY